MLTQEKVKELFDYVDGQLIRKATANHLSRAGSVAGSLSKRGYVVIRIGGKAHYAHRVAFLFRYGYLPEFIDHIDGNKNNNKIENLRPCSRGENTSNTKIRSDNSLRIKNVTQRSSGSYRVRIKHPKGSFSYSTKCKELAEFVSAEARRYYHGGFANA